MAKKVAELKVMVDNADAIRSTKKFGEEISALTIKLAELGEKLNKKETWGPQDTVESINKEITATQKRLDKSTKAYEAAVLRIGGIDDTLAKIEGVSYNVLARTRTTLTNALKNAKRETEEEIKEYEERAARLQKVRDEIAKRDIDVRGTMTTGKAAEVMASPKDYSTTEINQAIEATRKLRDMQQTGSTEWHNYNTQIEAAKKFLDDFNASVRQTSMEKQFVQLPTISDQALKDQKSYWQAMVSGAQQGSKELAEYEAKLKAVSAEEEERLSRKAGKVMGNLQDYSVEEIEESIKLTEKLQKAQQPGSAEWQIYGEEIKRAKEYLQGYIDLDKQIDMEDKWGRLPQLSANALAEQKKYWQEMVNGAANGSKELDEYEAKLKEVVEEEQMRLDNRYTKVMQNPESYSVKEVQDAVKAYEQLRDAQRTGSGNWEYYNQVIERTRATLKKYNDEAKATAMTTKLSSISTASTASLAEQKKYWQEMVAGAEKGSAALTEYEAKLKQVTDEERTRIQQQGKQTVTDINAGQWKGTIGETKEAIKQIQEYRNTLNAINDATALQDLDKALDTLTQKTKEAEQGFVSWQDALNEANNIDNFKGTIEQLEKMKKALQEARKNKIDIGDTGNLKQIDEALSAIDEKLGDVSEGTIDWKKIMDKDLKDISLNNLKRAAAQLEKEIGRCAERTEDFADKSSALRSVNAQIDSMSKKMKDHGNIIVKTAQRLASYVAVYGGFNFAIGKMKEVVAANLSLSDSMADVQKTTGMTAEEIKTLGQEIDNMDTRTSQQELYNLAATAGQLGIRGQEDIMGFVKASNMITVALNELGADGTATLMKIANLTGDITKEGTEGALLKIGSAINDLTATTTATAGPMVDFMSRFGGVASAAGIATHQMAAVGATADALKQEIEVTGTSMNKVVGAIRSNTRELAAAVNMDYQALKNLVDQGKTMEAIVAVFDAMRKSGGATSAALKALGSDGDRMNRVITSFVGNLDMLKTNLNTSAVAFEEMTSIQNEYNIKNENAAALLERIKNTIFEIFSNPTVVNSITGWLQSLKDMVDWLIKSEGAWFALKTILVQIVAIKVAKSIVSIKDALKDFGLIAISVWKNLKDFKAGLVLVGTELVGLVRGTTSLKAAFLALGMVIKTHPIMAIASIAGTAATAIYALTRNTKEATEVTDEFARSETELNNKFTETSLQAEELVKKIKSLNVDSEERVRLINEFNSKYSKYIGYMIQEKATVDEVTGAYELLNIELGKEHQLRLLKLQRQSEENKYVEGQAKYIKTIREELKGAGVEDAVISKTIAYINTLVAKGESLQSILQYIKENAGVDIPAFEQSTKTVMGRTTTITERTDWGDALNDYVEYGKAHLKKQEEFQQQAETINSTYAQDSFEAQKKYYDEEFARIQQLGMATEEEVAAKKTAYTNLYNTLYGYMQKATDQQKEELQKMIDDFKAATSQVDALRPIVDAWGKSANLENWTTFADTIKNLDKASPKSLAETLDAIEKESQDISAATLPNFNQMFQTNFDTSNIEKFNAQVKGLAKQIKDRLQELGRGTDANFLWGGSGSDKSAKKKAQEEYRAAMAALEAYFNERETLIQKKGLEEGKTQVQINQQLETLQTEKLHDEIELRKLLLDEYYKESTFDPSKYKGVISGTDYFKEKNMEYLNALRVQLEKWGVAMEDGMKKQLTDRMVKLAEQALRLREKINKILLEDNFTEQVAQQYLDSLQELGLLFGLGESEMTKTSEKEGRLRLAYMKEWSDQAYTLNAAGLQKLVEQNEMFSAWRIGRDAKDYEALLIQLRKFHDDQEEADRKAAERRKKIFENSQQGIALKESEKSTVAEREEDVDMYQRLNSLELAPDDSVDKAQIALYQAKIEASQAYIEQIKLEMQAEIERAENNVLAQQATLQALQMMGAETKEQEARVTEAQQLLESLMNQQAIIISEKNQQITEDTEAMNEVYASITERKLETLKGYTDAVVEFSEQMGEAAFGEVEDRQEAAKQLLRTTMQLTKDLIMQEVKRLIMKKALGQQEIVAEQTKETTITATKGAQDIARLTSEGAVTVGKVALGETQGAAKTIGELGWWGIPLIAVISAALSALMGMAMSALSKSKSEVAAATGASSGRLATGMLTYAEGNYPVLGNDGQVYNAKYEGANIKTGIYGGGAHFGIFSEKKPEAIIDGDTTQRLILNHPDIWQSIVTLSKYGRLNTGMRTFAAGNINELARTVETVEAGTATDSSAQMMQMQATMAATQQAVAQLTQVLAGGIKASINMYGDDGLYKQSKKAEKYANRVGYK